VAVLEDRVSKFVTETGGSPSDKPDFLAAILNQGVACVVIKSAGKSRSSKSRVYGYSIGLKVVD